MGKKTKTTSMGDNAGILGGIVNTFAGRHAFKTTGKHGTGYGHTAKQSLDDYNAKASKKRK